MSEAAEWIDRYREFWEVQLDALSHYLENQIQNEKNSHQEQKEVSKNGRFKKQTRHVRLE